MFLDADARAISGIYLASKWALEQGGSAIVDELIKKSSKMGDFLRNCMFDKYYKKIPSISTSTPGGTGPRDACHFLLSWYSAWGGSIASPGWAVRTPLFKLVY